MGNNALPEVSKNKNLGMTLVEILVVVAILAIMVGEAGIGISLLYSRDSEKCAKTINTMLETTRMSSLARAEKFNLVLDSENNECRIETDEEKAELPSKVTLSFSAEGCDLSGCKVLEVEFDKSTGRVKSVVADSVSQDLKSLSLIRIHAVSQNGKKASVVLVISTGKHYVEYGD